jgi:hypothetical protein
MTKQSDAKAAQGYVAKPVPSTCGNCGHFASDTETRTSGYVPHRVYTDESNLHCTLGSFAVKKMATCNQFAPKVAA